MPLKIQDDYQDSQAAAKLEDDLNILEAMAVAMPRYLSSDALYYPMSQANFPQLTLGGYLVRAHRLRALRPKLDQQSQERLFTTQERFQSALVGHTVSVEQKAQEELASRIQQWRAHIQDLLTEPDNDADFYAASVDVRAKIQALLNLLSNAPYRLPDELRQEVADLDAQLRNIWVDGDFVWPAGWEEAYPREPYWWLYGRPAGA